MKIPKWLIKSSAIGLVFLGGMIIGGCTNGITSAESEGPLNCFDGSKATMSAQNYIAVDKDTKIQYLVIEKHEGTSTTIAMTPRLNRNGKPMIDGGDLNGAN